MASGTQLPSPEQYQVLLNGVARTVEPEHACLSLAEWIRKETPVKVGGCCG
jgi:hypothetical protein